MREEWFYPLFKKFEYICDKNLTDYSSICRATGKKLSTEEEKIQWDYSEKSPTVRQR